MRFTIGAALARTVAGGAALAASVLLASSLTLSGRSEAQEFPKKQPIKVIIPFSAGSATDVIPRLVFEYVGQSMGQSFIFENRGGAGGSIGANAVAKAEPDGYTILVHSNAHVISPSVMSKLPYDVTKDFAGITVLGVVPNVLVIAPSQKINTVKEFVGAMKKRSGGMIYAAIVGTITHLNGEHFKKTMGIEGRMVPFKGAPAALTEVMAARVDVYFSPVLPALALLNDKKLVPLAVMGPKRVALLPDVPTGLESGYPDSLFGLWLGMYAPAKTPRPIIDKLYAETVKALERKEVKEKLTKMGVEQNPMPPDKFDAYVKEQVKQGEELAKLAGVYRSK